MSRETPATTGRKVAEVLVAVALLALIAAVSYAAYSGLVTMLQGWTMIFTMPAL